MLLFIGGMITGLLVAAICVGQTEKKEKDEAEKKNRQSGNSDGSKGGVL